MLLSNLDKLRKSDRNNISIAVIPFAVLIGIGKYRYIFGIRYDYIGVLAVILIIFLSFNKEKKYLKQKSFEYFFFYFRRDSHDRNNIFKRNGKGAGTTY